MPDLIWTGGISETHKVAILASAHEVPIAPHDATGPVNIFACSQICISSPNTMIQEHVPSFYKGWYNDIVDPNLDIRDGYLHAPRRPGVGTRLKAGLRDRRDAIVQTSDQPDESPIDSWDDTPHPTLRSSRMRAEVDRLREERGVRKE
jgi:L-alanine-DL-glutamate epimerase-like enolase superfamily enzyme